MMDLIITLMALCSMWHTACSTISTKAPVLPQGARLATGLAKAQPTPAGPQRRNVAAITPEERAAFLEGIKLLNMPVAPPQLPSAEAEAVLPSTMQRLNRLTSKALRALAIAYLFWRLGGEDLYHSRYFTAKRQLNLPPWATWATVKKAYKTSAMSKHPDKGDGKQPDKSASGQFADLSWIGDYLRGIDQAADSPIVAAPETSTSASSTPSAAPPSSLAHEDDNAWMDNLEQEN